METNCIECGTTIILDEYDDLNKVPMRFRYCAGECEQGYLEARAKIDKSRARDKRREFFGKIACKLGFHDWFRSTPEWYHCMRRPCSKAKRAW